MRGSVPAQRFSLFSIESKKHSVSRLAEDGLFFCQGRGTMKTYTNMLMHMFRTSLFALLLVSFFQLTSALSAQAACDAATQDPIAGICVPKSSSTGLSDKPVLEIAMSLMNWLLAIFGFIAIMAFFISGIQYMTAAGDEGQADTAKRNMKYSIIGVIVALSGFVIIKAITGALNASTTF